MRLRLWDWVIIGQIIGNILGILWGRLWSDFFSGIIVAGIIWAFGSGIIYIFNKSAKKKESPPGNLDSKTTLAI